MWGNQRGVDSDRGSLTHTEDSRAVNYHLRSCSLALKPCCYISFPLNALALFLCVCFSLTHADTHYHIYTLQHKLRAAASPPTSTLAILAYSKSLHFDSHNKKMWYYFFISCTFTPLKSIWCFYKLFRDLEWWFVGLCAFTLKHLNKSIQNITKSMWTAPITLKGSCSASHSINMGSVCSWHWWSRSSQFLVIMW